MMGDTTQHYIENTDKHNDLAADLLEATLQVVEKEFGKEEAIQHTMMIIKIMSVMFKEYAEERGMTLKKTVVLSKE